MFSWVRLFFLFYVKFMKNYIIKNKNFNIYFTQLIVKFHFLLNLHFDIIINYK